MDSIAYLRGPTDGIAMTNVVKARARYAVQSAKLLAEVQLYDKYDATNNLRARALQRRAGLVLQWHNVGVLPVILYQSQQQPYLLAPRDKTGTALFTTSAARSGHNRESSSTSTTLVHKHHEDESHRLPTRSDSFLH